MCSVDAGANLAGYLDATAALEGEQAEEVAARVEPVARRPARITRDHPRDLRQRALASVVEERTLRPQRAVVVLVLLPEKEDVVRVAVGDAVEADVVDLPRDSGLVEQVEDHRVAEDAEAPDAVRRDPARSARREVEPVRPRRPEDRAEVVRAERRVVEQAVVE